MRLRSGKRYTVKHLSMPESTEEDIGKCEQTTKAQKPSSLHIRPSRFMFKWLVYLMKLVFHLVAVLFVLSVAVILLYIQLPEHAGRFISRQAQPNYYNVLGVSPLADKTEIKAAYRSHALAKHPDKAGHNAHEAEITDIRAAYAVLTGEDHKRCIYDIQNNIEGRWTVDECIGLRKEFRDREDRRRVKELEEARLRLEAERQERQQRREKRLREIEEEKEEAKLKSRAAAAVRGFTNNVYARVQYFVGDQNTLSE